MKIIKEDYIEKIIYYTLDFDRKDDPGCGFTFPCDENGNLSELNPAAAGSYQFCIDNSKYFHEPRIKKHQESIKHGKLIKCDCGEIFELYPYYMGACECPKCEKWYNIFGQELKNPNLWEEDF